jgi:hypothetical protein
MAGLRQDRQGSPRFEHAFIEGTVAIVDFGAAAGAFIYIAAKDMELTFGSAAVGAGVLICSPVNLLVAIADTRVRDAVDNVADVRLSPFNRARPLGRAPGHFLEVLWVQFDSGFVIFVLVHHGKPFFEKTS